MEAPASSSYYVVAPDASHHSGILAARFASKDAAARYAKGRSEAVIFQHTKTALGQLDAALLNGICVAGAPIRSKTTYWRLQRDTLVDLAYGRLFAASNSTNGVGDFSPPQESTRMATTIGRGPKVREMRDGTKKGGVKKSTKSAKSASPAVGRPRADDEFAGKKFRLTDTSKNPRREGTHGFKSMEIVLGAKGHGIKYEDYIAAGGRRVDLKGSLDLKQVEIVA